VRRTWTRRERGSRRKRCFRLNLERSVRKLVHQVDALGICGASIGKDRPSPPNGYNRAVEADGGTIPGAGQAQEASARARPVAATASREGRVLPVPRYALRR